MNLILICKANWYSLLRHTIYTGIILVLLVAEVGEGNGNPLQYSCLENPLDRGAWRAAVHGVAKLQK